MNAGAHDRSGNAGGQITIANQSDAGAGGADVGNQLLVPRPIEDDHHEILDLASEAAGNGFEIVPRRRVEIDGFLRAGTDHQLLHVQIGRVQQTAAVRGRQHRNRVRRTGRTQVRALERIDGDIDLRQPGGRAAAIPRVRQPDLFANVQHRRLVALPLADDNRAVDRHRVHHAPHRLYGDVIGLVAIALSHRVRARDGGLFDDAKKFQREI